MCSLGCDYCWFCFGSPPKSFALAENFLTSANEADGQHSQRGVCELSNPRWLSAQHLGCPLSAWSPPLQVPWALGLAVWDHSTIPCRAKLPLPRPQGQTSAWECPSHRCQTLQPLVLSCFAEAGGIHGHFPSLLNLAVMFFTLREHKHVQRVQ